MRHLLPGSVLSLLLAAVLTLAVAGGVAAKEVSGVIGPFDPRAGEPSTVTADLTMDGAALPADIGAQVILVFTDRASGDRVEAEARPATAGDGWVATLTFPHEGTWVASGRLQIGPDRIPFSQLSGATIVEVAAPPAAAPPSSDGPPSIRRCASARRGRSPRTPRRGTVRDCGGGTPAPGG